MVFGSFGIGISHIMNMFLLYTLCTVLHLKVMMHAKTMKLRFAETQGVAFKWLKTHFSFKELKNSIKNKDYVTALGDQNLTNLAYWH